MGLFSALGNDGFGLWDYWSSKAANYGGPDECKRRWASFQDGVRITEATIFKLGMECGWKPPRSILPAPIKSITPRPPRASDTATPTSQPSPPPPGGEAAAVSSAEQAPRGEGLEPAGAEAPDLKVAADAPPTDFDAAIESLIADGADVDLPEHIEFEELPYGESASLFPGGEGEKGRKDKPKKVYGADHWRQVEDVLDNFVLIYGEDLVWDCRQRDADEAVRDAHHCAELRRDEVLERRGP